MHQRCHSVILHIMYFWPPPLPPHPSFLIRREQKCGPNGYPLFCGGFYHKPAAAALQQVKQEIQLYRNDQTKDFWRDSFSYVECAYGEAGRRLFDGEECWWKCYIMQNRRKIKYRFGVLWEVSSNFNFIRSMKMVSLKIQTHRLLNFSIKS